MSGMIYSYIYPIEKRSLWWTVDVGSWKKMYEESTVGTMLLLATAGEIWGKSVRVM